MEQHNEATARVNVTHAAKTALTVVKIACTLPLACGSLYCAALMLYTFCSDLSFRESSRYILFTYMLLNDAVELVVSVLLFLLSKLHIPIPLGVCSLFVTVSGSAYLSTPVILAAMALERYIAICVPLRHAEICTVRRSAGAIGIICALGLLPHLVELVALSTTHSPRFFSRLAVCSKEALITNRFLNLFRMTVFAVDFSVVTLTILYTYVKIILEARKASGDQSSISRARKTILLHGIQLSFCMTSFTHPITENLVRDQGFLLRSWVIYANFFLFILLPKALSPVIYGLRDEAFRKKMKKHFIFCRSSKIKPTVLST
eukprot:gi/632948265/ref/XP_007889495.1/ PREDICTED: olfactory receptor 52A5-like [Callorhinchus milii]